MKNHSLKMQSFLNPKTMACVLSFFWVPNVYCDDWPQAAGPNANWKVAGTAPIHWSAIENKNIKWRVTLPEGGQSSLTIWKGKGFLTTYKLLQPGDESAAATDIVGYCLDIAHGEIFWTVELPGSVSLGTAGVFSHATVFAPVTDGKHVWFFNRGGSIGCYAMNGKQAWLRENKSLREILRVSPRLLNTSRPAENAS